MAVAAETRDSLFNSPGGSSVPGRTNRMNTNMNRNRTGIREQMSRMNSGSNSFLKTFQSSNKQLVATIQQGDKRVSELLSKTYAANNNTASNLGQLVNLEARSYKRGRDYEVKVDKDKLGFMRTTANQIKSLFSLTKEQKERDDIIREEDVEFLEKDERANIERNEKLKKIEEALSGKASGGFIKKIMGAFTTAAGFVLGAAATSIGSLFKGIVGAATIRKATGAISAVSGFFGSIASRVGAVFGVTAAGSGKLRRVLRTVPIVGSVITGIMGLFSGIEAWQNVDEILNLEGKEATIANKVAASAGTFVNAVTFGFSDWLSTQFSFENTSDLINTGFDKVGDILSRVSDAIKGEFERFQSSDSIGAYAADVGNRAWTSITNVFSKVKNYVIGGLTSFVTNIDNFFRETITDEEGNEVTQFRSVGDMFSDIKDTIGGTFSYIGSSIVGLVERGLNAIGAPELFDKIYDSVSAEWSDFVDNPADYAKQIPKRIWGVVTTGFNRAAEVITNAKDRILDYFNLQDLSVSSIFGIEEGQTLADSLNINAASVNQRFGTFNEQVNQAAYNLGSGLMSAVAMLLTPLTARAEFDADQEQSVIGAIGSGLVGTISNAASGFFASIGDTLTSRSFWYGNEDREGAIDTIRRGMYWLVTRPFNQLEQFNEMMENLLEEPLNNFKDRITDSLRLLGIHIEKRILEATSSWLGIGGDRLLEVREEEARIRRARAQRNIGNASSLDRGAIESEIAGRRSSIESYRDERESILSQDNISTDDRQRLRTIEFEIGALENIIDSREQELSENSSIIEENTKTVDEMNSLLRRIDGRRNENEAREQLHGAIDFFQDITGSRVSPEFREQTGLVNEQNLSSTQRARQILSNIDNESDNRVARAIKTIIDQEGMPEAADYLNNLGSRNRNIQNLLFDVEPFEQGGIVNRPTLFNMNRGTGLMGEAGPEGIFPLDNGGVRTVNNDGSISTSGITRTPDGDLAVMQAGIPIPAIVGAVSSLSKIIGRYLLRPRPMMMDHTRDRDSDSEIHSPLDLIDRITPGNNIRQNMADDIGRQYGITPFEQGGVVGNEYYQQVAARESNNNVNAVSDTGATGTYQFTQGTWNAISRNYGEQIRAAGLEPSTVNSGNSGTSSDPRRNARAQELYARLLTEENARAIGSNDPGDLYLAHFMGPASARNIMRAVNDGRGSVPAMGLLTPTVQGQMRGSETNMSVVGGKTAAEVLEWAHSRHGSGGGSSNRSSSSSSSSSGGLRDTVTSALGTMGDLGSMGVSGALSLIGNTFGLSEEGMDALSNVVNRTEGVRTPASIESAFGPGYTAPEDSYLGQQRGRIDNTVAETQIANRRRMREAGTSTPVSESTSRVNYREAREDQAVRIINQQENDRVSNRSQNQEQPQSRSTPDISDIPIVMNDQGIVIVNSWLN